jgi:hypothetical protein
MRIVLHIICAFFFLAAAVSHGAENSDTNGSSAMKMVDKVAIYSKEKWRYATEAKTEILICPAYWRSLCRATETPSSVKGTPITLEEDLLRLEGHDVEVKSFEAEDRELRVEYLAPSRPEDVVGDSGMPETYIESSYKPDAPFDFSTAVVVVVAVVCFTALTRYMLPYPSSSRSTSRPSSVVSRPPQDLTTLSMQSLSSADQSERSTASFEPRESGGETVEPTTTENRKRRKRKIVLD